MNARRELHHIVTLTPEQRDRYLDLIERRLGLRLSSQQVEALPESLAEVLHQSGSTTAEELYGLLSASDGGALMDLLGADLTIGETHFFRIAPQIEALRGVVLPDLLARRAGSRRLAIWSAGCSSGEEPYTLAILLRDMLPAPELWDISVLATDLSHRALTAARAALYGEWSFRETPEDVRTRYFTHEGKRWRLAESIKRMVRFSHLNLMVDAFPSPGPAGPTLDLILCRNVTIYFSPEAYGRLYARLAEALSPGGWLVLGPSDPPPVRQPLLEPVTAPGAILWRRKVLIAAGETPAQPAAAAFASDYRPVVPALAGRRPGLSTTGAQAGASPRPAPRAEAQPAPARPLPDTAGSEVQRHLLLGLKHLDEGAVEEAIASLRRAAYLDSAHSLVQFSLGKAYLHGGDKGRARATFSHARRLLAALPAEMIVDEGGEMTAEELRFAVEAHLGVLGGAGE